MPRVATYPYRAAPEDVVHVLAWELEENGQYVPLPERFESWDPQTTVRARASCMMNVPAFRRATGVPDSVPLVVGLTWSCGATRMRGAGTRIEVAGSSSATGIDLGVAIDGSHLAGSVSLHLAVTLGDSIQGGPALVARLPGSVLWAQKRTIGLEGVGGRFPIQWVEFSSSDTLPADAAWWLDWDPTDLTHAIGGGVRLLLNSEHQPLAAALEQSADVDLSRLVFEAIYFDLGRTLITGALWNDDFVADPTVFEDGSIGAELRRLVSVVFGGVDHAVLSDRCRNERFRFDLELQDALKLLQKFRRA